MAKDVARRVLEFARATADAAMSDAYREASETRAQADREAYEIVATARRQAEQIARAAGNSMPGEGTPGTTVDQSPPG
jgi:regulator of protease activity HflC (stomatin/prohibitin superfamily)